MAAARGPVTGGRMRAFVARSMAAAGLTAQDAALVAARMADAELQGSDGHGLIRLPQYVRRIRAGGINARAQPRIVQERGATALLDGDNGMGQLVVSRALDIACDKARSHGIGCVGTRTSNHAGPASLYVREAVERGFVALYFAVGNANHLPPWGGLDLLLSTNPIAIGMPAGREEPVVLDMATTVAAYGKVKARVQRGEPLPEGWMVDRQGRPLTDPARIAEGLLLPIGGYKGYGLALMIGLLAGTLNGAAMGRTVVDFNEDHVTVTNTGQTLLVIDPSAFGDPAALGQRVDDVVGQMRGSARLPGFERIWLPGEQSHERRRRHALHGVPLPDALHKRLDVLADELAVERM